MKQKVVKDDTGKYLYFYTGSWRRPVIYSFKRLA